MIQQPVVLVTGGSRGIGRAVCLELARLNYAVVVNYATRPDAAQEVVQQIEFAGGRAFACKADVGRCEERQHLLEKTLKFFGRIDVLVNNAGITGFLETPGPHDVEEVDCASWKEVMDVSSQNMKSAMELSASTSPSIEPMKASMKARNRPRCRCPER